MDNVRRFWSKVDKSHECWMWTAYCTPKGYGQFRLDGRMAKAHRVAYELTNGPIPPGALIDHVCHNRSCVRPEHLRAVTMKQNAENREGARRDSKTGIRGVVWNKRDRRFQATVGHAGRIHHVGLFTDLLVAEAAVIAKRNELFTHNDTDRRHPND